MAKLTVGKLVPTHALAAPQKERTHLACLLASRYVFSMMTAECWAGCGDRGFEARAKAMIKDAETIKRAVLILDPEFPIDPWVPSNAEVDIELRKLGFTGPPYVEVV